jgi:branched-chain amino acid transport system ATP-binding protein
MAMLEVKGLSKSYGGLLANNDITFNVDEGTILGVIGPNGAGKSTLFDLITGYQPPDAGEVRFTGRRLRGLRPDQINRLGIGRTFQKLKPFTDMTVEENVMVGVMQHTPRLGPARRLALEMLDFVGLLEMRKHHAQALSTGQRKRLELARAMATRPRLLLMDEVTGGVDQRTLPGLIALVEKLKSEGVTLVIIEHNTWRS